MGGGCGFKPGGGLSRRRKDNWVKELKVLAKSKCRDGSLDRRERELSWA